MIATIKRGPVPSRRYADLHEHVERLDGASRGIGADIAKAILETGET